jgi:hypothetical protein
VETKSDLKISQCSPWLCGEKNFEVLVSERVQTDENIPKHMLTQVVRRIFKPQGQNFWLAQSNIEWHLKLVYRK